MNKQGTLCGVSMHSAYWILNKISGAILVMVAMMTKLTPPSTQLVSLRVKLIGPMTTRRYMSLWFGIILPVFLSLQLAMEQLPQLTLLEKSSLLLAS
jgi:hypothetical protein